MEMGDRPPFDTCLLLQTGVSKKGSSWLTHFEVDAIRSVDRLSELE